MELKHIGVLGMRWGVRKDRSSNSRSSKTTGESASQKRNSTGSRVSKSQRKVPFAGTRFSALKTMDDDELRAAIARIQLEKQYKDLVRPNTLVDRGRKTVNKILFEVAEDVGKAYLKKRASKMLKMKLSSGKKI